MPIPAAASSARASTSCGSCLTGTTVHGGYSRYFTPPPFELVGQRDLRQVRQHHGAAARVGDRGHPPVAERANYYDFGVQQKLLRQRLTLGVDSYYEQCTAPDR